MRGLWHRVRNRHRHRKVCPCRVVGYLWYRDGFVWALSPEDVEVVVHRG